MPLRTDTTNTARTRHRAKSQRDCDQDTAHPPLDRSTGRRLTLLRRFDTVNFNFFAPIWRASGGRRTSRALLRHRIDETEISFRLQTALLAAPRRSVIHSPVTPRLPTTPQGPRPVPAGSDFRHIGRRPITGGCGDEVFSGLQAYARRWAWQSGPGIAHAEWGARTAGRP